MTSPQISNELADWARHAGYALTADPDSEAAIFWEEPGGEKKYYIRRDGDGWYVVSTASRADRERHIVSVTSDRVMERYLWGEFGRAIRYRKGLSSLCLPTQEEQTASGFRVSDYDESEDLRILFDDAGNPIARAGDKVTSMATLVKLSNYLAAPLDLLIESVTDPDGHPLFESGRP